MTVSIYQNDFDANVIDIKTPFYPAWRDFARRIGGRWQWKHKRWEFDVKDEHTVREALRLVFGTDGEEGLASVDVRVALSEPLTSKVYDLGRRLGRPSKSEPGVVRWDTGVDPQDDEGLLLLVFEREQVEVEQALEVADRDQRQRDVAEGVGAGGLGVFHHHVVLGRAPDAHVLGVPDHDPNRLPADRPLNQKGVHPFCRHANPPRSEDAPGNEHSSPLGLSVGRPGALTRGRPVGRVIISRHARPPRSGPPHHEGAPPARARRDKSSFRCLR